MSRDRRPIIASKTYFFAGLCFLSITLLVPLFAKDSLEVLPLLPFCVGFGLAGIASLWVSFQRKETQEERIDAARNGIKAEEPSGNSFLFAFGLGSLLAGSAIVAASIPDIMEKEQYALLVFLLFPVIGAALTVFALIRFTRRKLMGATILFTDPAGGVIGGRFKGYFDVKHQVADSPVKMRLMCIESRRSERGSTISTVWKQQRTGRVKNSPDGGRVSFEFEVPDHLPEEGEIENRRSFDWKLECQGSFQVGSKTKNVFREWSLPMKKRYTGARAAAASDAFVDEKQQEYLNKAKKYGVKQVKVKSSGGYVTFEKKAKRKSFFDYLFPLIGLSLIVNGLMKYEEFHWQLFVGGIIAVPSLYFLGRKLETRIKVVDKVIFNKRSCFFIPLYSRRLKYFDEKDFLFSHTYTSSSGNNKIYYYALYAKRDRKKLKLVEGIEGQYAAEGVLAALRDKLFK